VSLSASPERYVIEVKDRGIGIPAAEQAEIFDPFFRAFEHRRPARAWLGLSVVKSCIEQHGGSVRFTSEANTGTTFFVELPKSLRRRRKARPGGRPRWSLRRFRATRLACDPAARSNCGNGCAGAQVPAAHAGKLRGIIVDDDPLVRSVLRDLLDASNEVVIVGEAGTVAQARLLARQPGPEVVFLDVNLPDGSGFDLLPELKPNTSVVFVTSAEEYAVHAFDCEAADFLLKRSAPSG